VRALGVAGAIFIVVGASALLVAGLSVPLVLQASRPGEVIDAEKWTLLPGMLGVFAVLTGWGLSRARPWALVAGAVLATAALLAGTGLVALAAIELYVFGGLALPIFLTVGAIGVVTMAVSLLVLQQLRHGSGAASPVTRADLPGFATITAVLLLAALGHAIALSRDAAITTERLAEQQVAEDLPGHAQVNARILDSSVGLAQLGSIRVRVVQHIELEVTISSDVDASLNENPQVCLWTRLWNHRGDPCWGQPDLGELLGGQLRTDPSGPPRLLAGRPLAIRVSLDRDPDGCDFPPGEWLFDFIAHSAGAGGNDVTVQVRLDIPMAGGSGTFTGELVGVDLCADPDVVVELQGQPP
jgi:hypothetical protein